MRKFFTKLHRWLSIPLGAVITVVSLTGALLVFEGEITRALDPHLYRVAVPPGAPRLTPSQLADSIRRQLPDSLELTALELPADPAASCMVAFRGVARRTLGVDPYTGEVLGWTKQPAFFQSVRKLHRWLLDAPASRGEESIGKRVVGISTLLLVVILVSGLVIWIPRSRKALKNRLTISWRHGRRRFWYDSHVALGFYATLLLLVMALTGLTWSFGWYRTAAYALFGGSPRQETVQQTARQEETRPETGQPGTERPEMVRTGGVRPKTTQQKTVQSETTLSTPHETAAATGIDLRAWDRVAEELRRRYPDGRSITLSHGEARIVTSAPSRMRREDKVRFDPADGTLRQIVRYDDLPRAQRLRGWFYALHTGTWGGLLTRILYFAAALIGASLPLTGYYLWLRRRGAAARRQPSPRR